MEKLGPLLGADRSLNYLPSSDSAEAKNYCERIERRFLRGDCVSLST
jgi:hypothetical protein